MRGALAAALALGVLAPRAFSQPVLAEYASPLQSFYLRVPADWRVAERRDRSDFSHPDFEKNRFGLTVTVSTETFSSALIERWKLETRRVETTFHVLREGEGFVGGARSRTIDYGTEGAAGDMRKNVTFVEAPAGTFRLECYALARYGGTLNQECASILESFKAHPTRDDLRLRRVRSYDGAFSLEIGPGWKEVTAETLPSVPETVLSLSRPAGTINLRRASADPDRLGEYVRAGADRLAASAGGKAGEALRLQAGGLDVLAASVEMPDLEVLTGAFSLGGRVYAIESVSRSPGLPAELAAALLGGLRVESPNEPGAAAGLGAPAPSGTGRAYLLSFVFGAMGLAIVYGLSMLYLSLPQMQRGATESVLRMPGDYINEPPAKPDEPWSPPMFARISWWPTAFTLAGAGKEEAMEIRKVGVIGAGTMGSGIAQLFAQNGIDVALFDANPAALRAGLDRIRAGLQKSGKMEALARVEPTGELEPLGAADLVVEAAFEDLEVKKALFRKLGKLLPSPKILATNTSSISVGEIGSAAEDPSRVLGMHFFNPAPVMRLIEVVTHPGVSDTSKDLVVELAKRLGKTPVMSADAPGFIANRLARPFYLKPLEMVSKGAARPSTIDEAMRSHGFKMGPFELMDLIGLEVNLSITKVLHKGLGERFKPSRLQEQMVEKGWFGRKSGKGFYLYEGGKPKGENPGVFELVPRPSGTPDLNRLFKDTLADVAEEAGRIVQERVATAEDVDTCMKLGFNWPKGPLEWFRELAV